MALKANTFKKHLIQAALNEARNTTKDMLSDNIIASFDEMEMANNCPGGFSDAELTDVENLNNKGNIATTSEEDTEVLNAFKDVVDNLLNISSDADPEDTVLTLDVHTEEDTKECPNKHFQNFENSKFKQIVAESILESEKKKNNLAESNYDAPLDFVPDTRINVSDVLTTLKELLKDDAIGIHVDQVYDDRHNNAYKVSQIDLNKLPQKMQVENVLLELEDDTYKINKVSDSFPLAK